jgi:hypothetical protein
MVEAGILAPVFAMMMMLNVYLGGLYETKYDSVGNARYYTWSNASNSCKGPLTGGTLVPPGEGGNGSGNGSNGTSATNPQSSPGGCSGQTPPTGSATSGMFLSTGTDTETWSYSPVNRFSDTGGAKPITTTGQVVCNEQNNGYNPLTYVGGLAGQLISSVKSGTNPCP